MIVLLAADGAVVQDADDLRQLLLETDLDVAGVRTALRTTGTGELVDDGNVRLDLAVLRSRAQLLATAPDWAQRWAGLVESAQREGRLTADGRSVQVHIEAGR